MGSGSLSPSGSSASGGASGGVGGGEVVYGYYTTSGGASGGVGGSTPSGSFSSASGPASYGQFVSYGASGGAGNYQEAISKMQGPNADPNVYFDGAFKQEAFHNGVPGSYSLEGPQTVDGSAICNDKASCKTLAATDSSWGCAYSKCYRKHGWGQMFGSCEPDPLKAKVLNRTKSSWNWESGPPGCFGSWSDENTCQQNCNDENRACGTKCEMDLNGFGNYIWTLTIQAQAQPITQAA